jgi:ADP-heptose:LPS heptosyltransferase
MSVYSYVYAISKLKFVVSIDSSSGHIASFYNIPSLTLWGKTTPVKYTDNLIIGFRPLRNNFSIVSKSEKIENITGEFVYETLKKLLENNFNNPDKIITYQDSLDDYNIVYTE